MTDNLTMRLWLLAMDALVRLGLFGSGAYLFAVRKASDAEWRQWPEVQISVLVGLLRELVDSVDESFHKPPYHMTDPLERARAVLSSLEDPK